MLDGIVWDSNNCQLLYCTRLDSTEMDHSENEDFTMASPLPGKKNDKRDDSEIVRMS